MLAALVQTRDAAGRRLLTTNTSWDRRGPRTIALSARGERRLGRALAAALLVVLTGIAAAMIDTDLLVVAIVLATGAVSLFATVAQGPVTRFLDSLGEERAR